MDEEKALAIFKSNIAFGKFIDREWLTEHAVRHDDDNNYHLPARSATPRITASSSPAFLGPPSPTATSSVSS